MFHLFSNGKMKASGKVLPVLLIAFILIYLSGCSSTYRTKVLSFFFDGVPSPALDNTAKSSDSIGGTDTSAIALNARIAARPAMNVHAPYQDKQCSSCHDQGRMGKLLKSQPELCYECHDDFKVKFIVLHGPVGGGQCTMCHTPHMSVNENLLIRTGQAVCLYCHDKEQVMKSGAHVEIKDVNCIECHNPHGGEDRYILN